MRRQIRDVLSGSSYISHSDLRLHFGLGADKAIPSIEVRWPSGLVERFVNAAIDTIVTVKEGTGERAGALAGNLPKEK